MKKLILISLFAVLLLGLVVAEIITTTRDKEITITKDDINTLNKMQLTNYYYEDVIVNKTTIRCIYTGGEERNKRFCIGTLNLKKSQKEISDELDKREQDKLLSLIKEYNDRENSKSIPIKPIQNGTTIIKEK